MDSKKKVTISWSGGKDSAFALFKILQSEAHCVVSLHTVINKETKRVGMHGVREELIEKQAASIGLPLTKLYLESSESHDAYCELMQDFYRHCSLENIDGVVFGDIFLEDLKVFRENLLRPSGLQSFYPLWGMNTKILAGDFIMSGFKTLTCSANENFFSRADIGRMMDDSFLKTLPPKVDPCGENGEFHTFVFDGPVFKEPVLFLPGEVVRKTYVYQKIDPSGLPEKVETSFLFQDLLP
jgi:uncharacterized protein (TIGR00290 family)